MNVTTVVGMTGTRNGCTRAQKLTAARALLELDAVELHHGDCVGADYEMALLAHAMGIRVIAHPPDNDSNRAWAVNDECRETKPYLERNHDIVDECDWLLAFPGEMSERVRSGTWATIRYARREKKNHRIILPDGSIT